MKIFRYFCLLGLCLPLLSIAADNRHRDEKVLLIGEVLYYADQGMYVDAITRLDIAIGKFYGQDSINPAPLHLQSGRSRISVGDLESSFRMYQRAAHTYKAISESRVDQLVRNEASYRLARVYQQTGDSGRAMEVIERIAGSVPKEFIEDERFLRGQIYLANRKYSDAVNILLKLQDAKSYKGFAAYNLGVALIKNGQEKQGIDQLDQAGKLSADDEITRSIRDKANLVLGYRLLDAKQPALGRKYLDQVRLNGPFSNRALLGSGWAEVELGSYEKALAPWIVLVTRDMTDKSVQESMLGVPYAYGKLNLPGKAANLYVKALDGFERELVRLAASLNAVREGKFLQALLREDMKQDETLVAKVKSLPETPDTRYLLELMKSSDFQDLLRNYLDLDDLMKGLKVAEAYLDSLSGKHLSAAGSNKEYNDQVRQLKASVHDLSLKADVLMTKHGHMLNVLATNELEQRRKQLQEYQTQARFGLAESYELALRKQQAPSGGEK